MYEIYNKKLTLVTRMTGLTDFHCPYLPREQVSKKKSSGKEDSSLSLALYFILVLSRIVKSLISTIFNNLNNLNQSSGTTSGTTLF